MLPATGYKRKRLDEIKLEIEQEIVTLFGEVNLEPDSVFGQLVGIISNSFAELYQDAENVYFSQYPATAVGVSLDNVAALVGVFRLGATRSRVTAALTGVQNTNIPAGSQVSIQETGEIFTNPNRISINASNAITVNFEIESVLDNEEYAIAINGTTIPIISGVGSTAVSIANELADAINASPQMVTASVTVEGFIKVVSDNLQQSFSSGITANLEYTTVTSLGFFQAMDTGAIMVLTGTLNVIVTPIGGWNSITNLFPAVTGRARETDEELRARRNLSSSILGGGSIPSIRSNLLQNVQDVTEVFIFENRLSTTDIRGRPSHSFEAVIQGGSNEDIANEIWRIKPAGIESFGNVTVLVTDSNSDQQAIRFSRATLVYIWVRITLASYGRCFSRRWY